MREMDSQAAKYMLQRYASERLGAGVYLYDFCVNTSTRLQAGAAVITTEPMRAEEDCTLIPKEAFSPCQPPPQR